MIAIATLVATVITSAVGVLVFALAMCRAAAKADAVRWQQAPEAESEAAA